MSKDPAFLFYPGDWLGGTITFTRAQKGAYMDLLMAQFNQAALTIDDIKQVLGQSDFESMWELKLKAKFEVESEGRLYFNRRLRDEIIRRKTYVASRANNKKGKNESGHMTNHMTNHMTGHMENENENENSNKIKGIVKGGFKPPALEEVMSYCKERGRGVDPQKWHNFYTAKDWMIGKNKMKDWKAAVRTWEKDQPFVHKPEKNEALDKIKQWEKERYVSATA